MSTKSTPVEILVVQRVALLCGELRTRRGGLRRSTLASEGAVIRISALYHHLTSPQTPSYGDEKLRPFAKRLHTGAPWTPEWAREPMGARGGITTC